MTNLKNNFQCLFLAPYHLDFEPNSFCFSWLQGSAIFKWVECYHSLNEILKMYSSLYLKRKSHYLFFSFFSFFLFKLQNHLCLPIYGQDILFLEFQICLELTKYNIWISIQEGRLIWKLLNAPGPQWDQIEEQFLWAECKWIRNMWIKFLLNLKGNLNIKEKCFVNGFIASDKVRHLKKELVMTTESKICPVFFLSQKRTFLYLHKRNRTMDWKLLMQ